MSDAPTNPAPRRSLWRRLRIGRWLFVALLATCGFFAWREYDLRLAIAEAKKCGWEITYDGAFEKLEKDWKNAFDAATWRGGHRHVGIARWHARECDNGLLRRLAPRSMTIMESPELRDLSSFARLPTLQSIALVDCKELSSVDALRELSGLKRVLIQPCHLLTNIDALGALPELEALEISSPTLTNLNPLGQLVQLKVLRVLNAQELTNVDVFESLTNLEELVLDRCKELRNLDGVKHLTRLKSLSICDCTGLSRELVDALRAAMPETKIDFRKIYFR